MSNANLKDILQAVESTLTASPSLVNSTTLKEVAIGHSKDFTAGFPAARVYTDTFGDPLADTISYERPYGIAIDIWQEITNKSKRDAELDLAYALHKVLDRLAGTWQLGISVENSEMQNGQIRSVETPAGPMLLAPLRLVVTTLIQNPA